MGVEGDRQGGGIKKKEKVFIQSQRCLLCCGRDLSYIRSLSSLQSLERGKMSQKEEGERDRGRQTEGGDTPILSESSRLGHISVRNDRRKMSVHT